MIKPILKSLYQNSRNEEIKKLIFNAFSKDYNLHRLVAKNPSTPVSILERLSRNENVSIRVQVTKNPSTPEYILEKLSNDEESYVRYWVKQNPTWIKSRKANHETNY